MLVNEWVSSRVQKQGFRLKIYISYKRSRIKIKRKAGGYAHRGHEDIQILVTEEIEMLEAAFCI
jgi:hypothetical protein